MKSRKRFQIAVVVFIHLFNFVFVERGINAIDYYG